MNPPTYTADFYDGRGLVPIWLGSLEGDVHPATVMALPTGRTALETGDPSTYALAVADLVAAWSDNNLGRSFQPADGWPWPWDGSDHTDWIFSFHDGGVWASTGHAATATGLRLRADRMRDRNEWQ